MKSNWLKMYDKFGLILRVETVINSPKEFWVYRTRRHRDGTSSAGYYPMTKSVASLVDYQEQALACNRRYLDALAVVDDPTPAYPELRQLTEPKVVEGRSYAGFNPARRDDVRLFKAVLDGDHIARGFRNARHPRAVVRDPQERSLRNAGPVRRWGDCSNGCTCVTWWRRSRARGAGGSLNVADICSAWPCNSIAAPGHNWQHDLWLRFENFSASCGEVHWKESSEAPPQTNYRVASGV